MQTHIPRRPPDALTIPTGFRGDPPTLWIRHAGEWIDTGHRTRSAALAEITSTSLAEMLARIAAADAES